MIEEGKSFSALFNTGQKNISRNFSNSLRENLEVIQSDFPRTLAILSTISLKDQVHIVMKTVSVI